MVDLINTLISECLDRHAPQKRVKITRLPAPWLHAADIRQLQAERDKPRLDAHNANNDESWAAFRAIPKKIIAKAKRSFFMTALSSKRSQVVWRVIHRVLNPGTSPPRADPDQLNKYFIATNEMTLGTTPDATSDLLELAKSLPEHSQRSFKLCHVTFEDVMKEIHHLRSDCSTGVDQIPVKFVKLISEHIAGPLSSSLSNQRYLNCGVPQGSCLGPLLFVMYFCAVQGYRTSSPEAHCYADDTQLYVSFKPDDANAQDEAIRTMEDCNKI